MIQTWRQRVNNKQHYLMPCGCTIRKQYMLNIDDKGCEYLVHSGDHDQYAEIQSYRESCDLQMILNTLDPMAVNRYVSTYKPEDIMNVGLVDIAAMPTSYGGMFNLVKKGENFFNGLPEEIRSKFNYSVKKFCSSFGSDDFNNIFAQYIQSQQPQPQPTPQPQPSKRGRKKKTEPEGDDE